MPLAAACKVKAIFGGPPDGVPEKAVLFTGAKSDEIELPKRNLSPEVKLPEGDLVVAVLAEKPNQPEIPPEAPKFKIPGTWTDCILLFFHDPKNKVFPVKVIPVNASAPDFPLGNTVMFNVSTATVMAKFGDQIVKVAPGTSASVKPPRVGSGD
jgi:hypothetical protein